MSERSSGTAAEVRQTADAERATPGVARARWAITGVFFINGLLLSTYLVRIPSLKASLGLTESQLGVVLTCYGVAAVLAMQSVGRLVARFGSARVILVTLAALPFALVAIGFAGDVVELAAAVTVAGAAAGTIDAAMNAHAVVVERLHRRPIMNGCHAAWSISAIVASLLGAAVIRANVSVAEHTLWVGGLLLPAAIPVALGLLPASADREPKLANHTKPAGKARYGWTGAVLVFGCLGLVLMLCEAAVISWSGVFLHEGRGATLAVAALGYGAYTLFQTFGRLAGDPLTERFGRVRMFRAHALVAVAGFVVVLAGRTPLVSLAGFAVLGFGTSVLVPLIFSAVGHAGGQGPGAARFVSRATTFTYAGILIGPALVGWLAQGVGLNWTFAALIPLMVLTALSARVMRPPSGDGAGPVGG
ncbi:MFS transporter [Amycolatopsis sp. A133]|uniref:MFS transporter n=1 Tax=Amycolatopsis sp. A133 TaxID=3064472 RepID=UPI0027FF1142|nr:MFS transporter [Amycolatopsis sp. A133]MDQ7810299.1 MFS transporter [Amycolatopsis sp. A133]